MNFGQPISNNGIMLKFTGSHLKHFVTILAGIPIQKKTLSLSKLDTDTNIEVLGTVRVIVKEKTRLLAADESCFTNSVELFFLQRKFNNF